MGYPNDPNDPESWDEDKLLSEYRTLSKKLADLTAFAEANQGSQPPETVTMNTRSMSNALRDLATLLEHGNGNYVVGALRSLADRVEQMACDEAERERDH